MPLVVGVTFRRVGKVYYFDPGAIELHEGDFVIAETARGVEFGEVVLEPRQVPDEELVAPLKNIVRVATGDDLEREASNRDREKHAYEVCDRKISEHNLPMKLLDAEFAFDGSQVTFSFSAEGRVDFRELVKDVASVLHTKVQLHQIGVRDEAKLIGGYGGCGRPLCCATFLSNFEPISMKMAKDQSLFLNPAKFSGSCGKLMCCLRYEHEFYKQAQRCLPSVGAILDLGEQGRGKVIDVNVVTSVLTVQTEADVQLHIPAGHIKLAGLCRRHGIGCNMADKNCQQLQAGDYDLPPVDTEEDDPHEEEVEVQPPSVVEEERPSGRPPSGVQWREPRPSGLRQTDNREPRREPRRENTSEAPRPASPQPERPKTEGGDPNQKRGRGHGQRRGGSGNRSRSRRSGGRNGNGSGNGGGSNGPSGPSDEKKPQ